MGTKPSAPEPDAATVLGQPDPQHGACHVICQGRSYPPNNTKANNQRSAKLADRLLSHSVSKLLDDQPELQRDMRTAARVIRALLSKVDRAAAICSGAACHLRDFTIEVGKRLMIGRT